MDCFHLEFEKTEQHDVHAFPMSVIHRFLLHKRNICSCVSSLEITDIFPVFFKRGAYTKVVSTSISFLCKNDTGMDCLHFGQLKEVIPRGSFPSSTFKPTLQCGHLTDIISKMKYQIHRFQLNMYLRHLHQIT